MFARMMRRSKKKVGELYVLQRKVVYRTFSKTELQFRFPHQLEISQRVDNLFTNTGEYVCVCVRIS